MKWVFVRFLRRAEKVNTPLEDIPQKLWDVASSRETVIKALARLPRVGLPEIKLAAGQLNLKRSSVYRLLTSYRDRPQTTTLLPKRAGREQGSRVLGQDLETIIESTIDAFYLTRERPRFAALMREIRTECRRRALRAPDYRTVKRRVSARDQRGVTLARDGSKRAKEQFGPIFQQYVGDEPLKLVQIDHTLVDVIVVEARQRRPIGRPWLSLAIDVPSRVVAGFYLTLDAPSALSVALLLTHAVLPKETWLAERQIDLPWPVSGLPDRLHLDNAKEFHSRALSRGTQEYGMALEFRPPGAPHFGGHIERLIGTVMGKVHLLPGTTFSNVRDRDQYDSEKAAVMTMEELERWLVLEIGVYHRSIHSALLKPPLAAWTEGIAKRREPPRLPGDTTRFFRDFLPGERRLIRKDAIRLFNVNYWDNILSPLAGRSSSPVLVKYDPRDLSRVYYQDEKMQYWPIPYRDLRRPPISRWEQREATKQLRGDGRRLVDEQAIFESIEAQRTLVSEARTAIRQRRKLESQQRSIPPVVAIDGKRSSQAPAPLHDQDAAAKRFDDLPPFPVEEL